MQLKLKVQHKTSTMEEHINLPTNSEKERKK